MTPREYMRDALHLIILNRAGILPFWLLSIDKCFKVSAPSKWGKIIRSTCARSSPFKVESKGQGCLLAAGVRHLASLRKPVKAYVLRGFTILDVLQVRGGVRPGGKSKEFGD